MNKTNKFSIKKFIFSIAFNAIILIVSLTMFKPFFEENDDTQIAMIVEGLFGVKEWHVIYPNFILGKIYVLLQSIVPTIRWHVILQYAFIFIAYVFLVYVLSKHKRGLLTGIVAVLATFYELYISIQYTKTAAFVCVAGYILFFEYVRNKTSNVNATDRLISKNADENAFENSLFVIMGAILIIYGALLRPESVFIAAIPAAAVGLLELIRTKNIKRYCIVFVPIFMVVVLLRVVDSYVYNLDSDWSRFRNYNYARMQLNDYRYDILDFSKYEKELTELNVSKNDALAILTYQYGDDDALSFERFKEIRDAFPAKEFGYETFANLYENLVNEAIRAYVIVFGLFCVLIMLIASIVIDRSKSSPGFIKDSRRKLLGLMLMGVFCAITIVYFQYSGRFSHRLVGAMIIPVIFLSCFIIDSIYIKDNNSKIIFGGNKSDVTIPVGIIFTAILLGLNVLLYFGNIREYNSISLENNSMLRELDEIAKDKDSLYIADTFTFQNVYKYEVFNTFEEGALSNFVTCGSWYINSPITKRVTRSYGYENPYEALRLGGGNVYLLDNQGVECKTLFLTEHYDKLYVAEKLENRGGIDVYQVVESADDKSIETLEKE